MDFEKAIRPLGRFTPMLEKVPQAVRDAVFDIRISVDKPVLLCCGDRILFLREDGDTAQYFSQNNVTATREDVEEIFLRLCGYSVYSHMEEIRGGFVSADRALRVGIGGTAVIEKGGIKTVRDVTSLSVRIPREKRGCAEEVLRYGVDLSRGLLLAGAPSSGKTTLLRDIARYIGTAGHRVVVLDERFELSADGFDLGACTDILQGYPKQEGLSHAVRCLSPEYIVCDELGENDFSAIRAASFSGVALIASIHAGSVHELCCRPLCRGILSLGAFETVALLHGRSAPTKVEKLFSLAAAVLVFLCILPQIETLTSTFREWAEFSGMPEVFGALLKALGIVLIGCITADLCKDAGESAIASGVELAVKTAVLLTALPLLNRLLSLLQEVLLL